MARVHQRRAAPVEGAYGIKFTEIVVIVMVLAAIGYGLKWYFIDYRRSPSYALQQYFSAVKAGDVKTQYAMLDDDDKAQYMPKRSDYKTMFSQSQGYTERVVNVNITPEPSAAGATTVTLNATVEIRANATGKESYQAGTSQGFTDKYVMRKDKDGAWKLVLSKSGDGKGTLNLEKAQPTPPSQFDN